MTLSSKSDNDSGIGLNEELFREYDDTTNKISITKEQISSLLNKRDIDSIDQSYNVANRRLYDDNSAATSSGSSDSSGYYIRREYNSFPLYKIDLPPLTKFLLIDKDGLKMYPGYISAESLNLVVPLISNNELIPQRIEKFDLVKDRYEIDLELVNIYPRIIKTFYLFSDPSVIESILKDSVRTFLTMVNECKQKLLK